MRRGASSRTLRAARRSCLAGSTVLMGSAASFAAGGHFDVDDAVMLDPGQCQSEVWVLRAPASGTSLLHLGPGCRLGAVEATVNIERSATADGSAVTLGPQLKWSTASTRRGLSVGAVWGVGVDVAHGGRPAQTAYLPLTWSVAAPLQLHLNVGVDRDPQRAARRRLGVSAEWAPRATLTVIAERSEIAEVWTSRAGLRFGLGPSTSVDLSIARAGAAASRVYGVGLNRAFAR